MKITKIKCDMCGKEKSDTVELRLPVIINTIRDGNMMRVHDLDICTECANKICTLYYQVAEKNNHTGIRAMEMEE